MGHEGKIEICNVTIGMTSLNNSVKDENKILKDKLTAFSDRQSAIEEMLLALLTDLPKEKLVK